MTEDRAKAHGRASHAVVTWLHGRQLGGVSLHRPIDDDEPEPTASDEIEAAIRTRIADAVGEMLAAGGRPVDHLPSDRPEVKHALRLAGQLPGDAIDHLERCFEDLCATLHSPRVKRAISDLAEALLSAPRGEMSRDEVSRRIVRSVRAAVAPSESMDAYPRTIHLTPSRRSGNGRKR
jgi:hypothetical protein